MPKPQDMDELLVVLKTHFANVYEWQMRVNNRLSEIEDKVGGHQDDDPPPPPPDFG